MSPEEAKSYDNYEAKSISHKDKESRDNTESERIPHEE